MARATLENNHLIDGADNNERLQGTAGVRVSIDAVAEVKDSNQPYTAELGRTSGGVINIITKSGTNNFSGSAFELTRRARFDERTYFATEDPIRVAGSVWRQPRRPDLPEPDVLLRRLRRLRLEEGQPNLITVPTMAMRNGDFSSLLPGTIIYDPTTDAADAVSRQRHSAEPHRPDRAQPDRSCIPDGPHEDGGGQTVNNFSGQTIRTQDSEQHGHQASITGSIQNNTLWRCATRTTASTPSRPASVPTATVSGTVIDPELRDGRCRRLAA